MFSFLQRKTTLCDSGLLQGAADHHSHILFGVDDGVRSLEESLAILDWYAGCGISHLWCTPHIMEDVPNTTDGLKARFQELKAAYKGPLQLHLAAEYMLDNLYQERLEAKDILLHGEDRILVETSTIAPPLQMQEILERTMSLGYRPILAHPERYRYMRPEDYSRLQSMGVLMQLNLPSLTGLYGKDVMARAQWLLKRGFYHLSGSDCHREGVIRRQYGLKVVPIKFIESLKPIMPPYTGEE